MEEDIQKLLSGIYTDALLALDGTWDKSDSGFRTHVELIVPGITLVIGCWIGWQQPQARA